MTGTFSNKRNFLTVEIGEKYLKMAHVRVSSTAREVLNASASDINNVSADDISTRIRDFAKKSRVSNVEVISVIPSNFAVSKNIEIPSIDKKEIKDIIDLQAGRHTPYARDEIIMDYTDIGVFHGRYTKILLVIVKRDVVTKRYDIIKKAGFKAGSALLASEVTSRFCFNNCPNKPKDGPIAVVHVDKVHLDFSVVNKGKIVYIRPIAMDMIFTSDKPEENKMNFVVELKKSLESYQAENIEALPSRIYFTGMIDFVSEIKADIQKAMGIDIDILPDLKILGVSTDLPDVNLGTQAASLLPAIASSMVSGEVGLSLVPEDIKVKKELKVKAWDFTKMGILVMAILIVFCVTLLFNMFFKELYMNKIFSSYTKERAESQRLKDISDRTSVMKEILNQKGKALSVLTELFNVLSAEAYLSSINFKSDNTLSFTGTADTMSRVFSMVTDLENNKFFKNVKVDFTKSRRVKEKEVADFGLTMSIEEYLPHEKTT